MIKPGGESLGCETMIGLAIAALFAVAGFGAAISEPSNCGGSLAIGFAGVIFAALVLFSRATRTNTPEEVRIEARRILAEEKQEQERKRNEEKQEQERKRKLDELMRKEDECSRSEYQAVLKIVVDHFDKAVETASNQIFRLIISSLEELRRLGKPPTIYNEYFSLIDGEEIYFYAHNVDCKVPHARSAEEYSDGTLAITNKRVVFACEDHKQTYRIDNIRDFKPTWLFNLSAGSSPHKGEIDVASSEKRREIYSLENSWLPTLLLMFLWNDSFRERVLTTEPQAVVKRIIARASVRCDLGSYVDAMVHSLQPVLERRHKRLFDTRNEQADIKVMNIQRSMIIAHHRDNPDYLRFVSGPLTSDVRRLFTQWAMNMRPEFEITAVIKLLNSECNNALVLKDGIKTVLSSQFAMKLLEVSAGWGLDLCNEIQRLSQYASNLRESLLGAASGANK